MAGNISFNPSLTLNGTNTFQKETQGWIQGAVWDDPVARMWLLSGTIDSAVTQPIWGGMAITESVPAATTNNRSGSVLSIASDNSTVTGFTVFTQVNNAIIVPGNTVPVVVAGQSMAFFRFGSNIRIPVKVNATLAPTLNGGAVNQQVSWDFTNQELIAYSSGVGALACKVLAVNDNSKYVVYDSGTGSVTWDYGYVALIQI